MRRLHRSSGLAAKATGRHALLGQGWLRVKQRLEAMRDADAVPFTGRSGEYRTVSQEHFLALCAEGDGDVELVGIPA